MKLSGRLVAALAALAIAVTAAGCGASASPPANGAAAVVPSDALAYVHVSLDGQRPEVREAVSSASRLPGYNGLSTAIDLRLGALTGVGAAFGVEAKRWLGAEGAVALLPSGGTNASLLIALAARSPAAASRFLQSSATTSALLDRTKIRVYRYQGGIEATLLSGFVIIGQRAAVHQAAAVEVGSAASLSELPGFQQATRAEPASRVLDAYLPAIGVAAILGGRGGAVGALGTLLGRPGLKAVAAALSPDPQGFDVWLDTVGSGIVPRKARSRVSASELPGDLALALQLGDLPAAAPRLLRAAAALGAGTQLAGLLHRAGVALTAEGVNLEPLLGLFKHGAALGLTAGGGLVAVGRSANAAAARLTLAGVAGPLAQLFPSSGGAEPVISTRAVGPVELSALQLGGALQLDWAAFGGRVVVATSASAVVEMITGRHPLSGNSSYLQVIGQGSSADTALLFANLSRLVTLAAQAGLLKEAGLGSLTPDLARIRAIGLRESGRETDTTAELKVTIP